MKKRVLSMLLAFILCFSTLPMTAFAQEADVVTEQAGPAAEQEEQQATVPAAGQEEAEAAVAPGAETPADKSTTAVAPGTEDSTVGEATDTVKPSVESVSDSDAGTQDTSADDEKKAAVQKVQALIDALPDEVTVENAESVGAQLEAIDEAMESLTKEQIAELDMTRLHAISEAMNAPMTVAEGEHTHCICGMNHQNIGDHQADSQVTFKKLWMDNGTLKIDDAAVNIKSDIAGYSGECIVLPSGNYYLDSDLTLSCPIYIGQESNPDTEAKDVNLCLNGKSITANGDFDTIILFCGNSNAKMALSLTDCQGNGKITHADGKNGCGVYVDAFHRATFNMYRGSITGNNGHASSSNTSTPDGGGVYMNNKTQMSDNGGIFNMYGGTISNNSATNGGGLFMCNNVGNIFRMYGGSITGNTATGMGGGVYSAGGDITMTGGSIENNNASQGGGMYESGGSSVFFTMSGGSITKNTATDKGGGVYVSEGGNFKISGSVQITGNTKESAVNNVELAAGKTITIQSGLAEDASIGVTTEKTPGTGDYSKVASGAEGYFLTGADANRFFSDVNKTTYTIKCADNKLILTNTGDSTLHYHPICGETCTHKNADGTFQHKAVYWEATSDLNDKMPAGYYYLTQNVTLTQSWRPAAGMVLDLNGHDIIMNADGYVISRGDAPGAFTLTDCMGGQGRYGKITHGNNYKGGGIQLASSAYYYYTMSFEMYGGSITGNTGSYPGVCLEDNSTRSITFNMYGGEITNNKNTSPTGSYKGGGVYVAAGNTFTMTGGKITGNQTATVGGGVYVEKQSNKQGNFIVSGDARITENYKTDGTTADNVYLQSVTNGTQKQAYIQVNGALSNNASIGVNAGTIDEGSYKIVAQGSEYQLTDSDLQRFTSDASYTPKLVNNRIAFTNGTPHEHPICGKTDCNDDHSNELWNLLTYDAGTKQLKYGATTAKREPITNLTGHYVYTLPAGHYYLAQDITLEGSISISGDVNICLNGHEISTNQYNRVFEIKNYKLAVCDCSTSHSGKIRGNQQSLVVYLLSSASFDLYGGTICGGNYGVYENMASSVTLFGGSITSNTSGVGGSDTPLITIGGDAKVINNTTKNLYLRSNQVIRIDDSLTQDARIGISTVTNPSANNNIQIATSATNTKLDYSKIFTSDATDQNYVVTKDAKGKLYLGIHQHNWQATAEGAQITFKCSADGCKLESDFATTYTVTAPTDLIYSGSEKVATVTKDDKYSDGLGLPTIPAITYQKLKETEYVGIEGAPKDVGTYRASITIENVTASVTYNIVSKEVANPTITVAGTYTYDGTKKEPSVVVKDGETEIPDSEYSVSYANNINVGNATVTITDVAGGNYNVSGSTTFTIDKGTYTGTVGKTVNIIKNRVGEQTGTLTVADFFPEGKVPASAQISDLATATSGIVIVLKSLDTYKGYILTYIAQDNITSTSDQTCAVTISSANYQDIQATLTFHPTDKETVTISGLTYTEKTYDGSAIQPTGTLKVSGDKVPVNDLKVTYTGIGDTTYNGTDAPTDAGTYQVTYKVREDNDNYIGEKTYTFTIFPKAVTADMIGAMADETYTGSPITPQPVVTDGNTILTSGTDFAFSYDTNTDAGAATLTITGKGNYTGTANQKFTIKPKDISSATIRLHNNSFIYDGIAKKVEIASVTLGENTNTLILTSPTDYDIKAGNTFINANDAITLTIAGKGNYTGTAYTIWKITKASPVLGNFDVSQNLSTPLTYDGTPKTVTAQPRNGVIGMGAVTVCYEGSNGTTYARSETAPANAGTYQVILSVVEGKNYTKAEIAAGTLTIGKADLTVGDVTEFFEYTKTGAQTISLAELVPGATNYAPGTYTDDNGILTGDLTIDATGLMKFTLSALTIANIDNKVTVPVTITSENYKNVTVNVTIYISPEYRIIDGAGSSWTQNTTGTVVIRGNGEYNRFRAVKVDGKVIDPANYAAKEGSTIITLKAEYLKTLATGSHTFAIVWDNGIAGTNFTVAANTSGNNSGNNSNNNDSNHGSNNSGNTAGTAANTAAASAQELDKVPATGDPFGIWLTLFAISLIGLAGMLARRKKN